MAQKYYIKGQTDNRAVYARVHQDLSITFEYVKAKATPILTRVDAERLLDRCNQTLAAKSWVSLLDIEQGN